MDILAFGENGFLLNKRKKFSKNLQNELFKKFNRKNKEKKTLAAKLFPAKNNNNN